MTPLFSVIVPVFNAELYLSECVDSILAQTYADLELILVDDGSTDGCPALCDGYAVQDPRVTVIHQRNAGVVTARKVGLDRAGGEYICFVDSDDTIAPDLLDLLRRHIEENGRPDMLIHGITRVREGRSVPVPILFEPGLYDKSQLKAEIYPHMIFDETLRPFPTQRISGYLPCKAYRRELVREHYIADARLTLFEDTAMVFECMVFSDAVYICEECPYFYRIHSGSALGSYHADTFRMTRLCFDYMHEHIGGVPEIDRQLNIFGVSQVVWAVYDEFRHGHSFSEALDHVRAQLRQTRLGTDLRFDGLDLKYRLYLLLIKCRAYFALVLTARILFRS